MNNNITASRQLAKAHARADLMCLQSDSEPFIVKFNNSFDRARVNHNGCSSSEEPNGEIEAEITSLRESNEQMLEHYAECIKEGLIILTMDFEIPGDVSKYDIDQIATIGLNTSTPQEVDGETAHFDSKKLRWVSESGIEFEYSLETGLPTTKYVIDTAKDDTDF